MFDLGGQRLLAVDIPGPSAAEDQQGTLLPAAVEAPSSLSPESRGNKGEMGSDVGSLSLLSTPVSVNSNPTSPFETHSSLRRT